MGRSWHAIPGNLYLSVLLRGIGRSALPWTTLGAGVVVAEAAGPEFALKWPNDVLDSRGDKLAGVLCEASWADGELAWVVVGIGLNLTHAPDGVGATCLGAHGIEVGLEEIAEQIRAALVGLDWATVRRRWIERSCTLGRTVRVGEIEGIAVDIAEDGALLVDTGAAVERVITGDVGFVTDSLIDPRRRTP